MNAFIIEANKQVNQANVQAHNPALASAVLAN